jgi:hypothetical protein
MALAPDLYRMLKLLDLFYYIFIHFICIFYTFMNPSTTTAAPCFVSMAGLHGIGGKEKSGKSPETHD